MLALLKVTLRTVNLSSLSIAITGLRQAHLLLVAEGGTNVTTVEDEVTEEATATVLHEDT